MWGNFLTGSRNGFFIGLVMVVTGIGLTIASAALSLEFGWGVSFVFYGLIFVGLIRMVLSAPSLLFGDGDGRFAGRSRRPLAQPYVAPPNEMPLGRCWMCGGKVKHGNVICLHCGAAQPPTAAEESETSRLSGFDPGAGELITFLPSDGPAAATPYPSAPYPAVNPGAYPPPERAGQWNSSAAPAGPPPGDVWRPMPESEGDWDEEPARRPRWRLR